MATPNENLPLLLVNQVVGSLFLDVIKAAQKRSPVSIFNGCKYRRSSVPSRIYTWLKFSAQLSFYLVLRGRQHKCALFVSNPPFAPLLAPLCRRPYALLLYDLYPQVLSQIQPKNPILAAIFSVLIVFWHAANRQIIPRASRVFTLSESMASQLKTYFEDESTWRQRVSVIPPWSDSNYSTSRPIEATQFRQSLNLCGLLVTYSGNMGLTHPLEILIQAAELLEQSSCTYPIHFLLIGEGSKRYALQQQADLLQLPSSRVRFLDPLPPQDFHAMLSASDLAVVALDSSASSASLPSKTFNALACGTPILSLADSDSALSQLVKQYQCGVVIEPSAEAPTLLVDSIQHLLTHPIELQRLSVNAELASLDYTDVNADKLLDLWLG